MAKQKDAEHVIETEEEKTEEEATPETTEASEAAEAIAAAGGVDSAVEGADSKQSPQEEVLSLEKQLEQARQEAAQNLEGWQRTAAELANFKRRQEEQRKLQRDRIKAEVLEGVISALDDMVIAFQHVPEELDGQLVGWVEGFRLVQRKLDKILDDQNVMPINTEGKFDPNLHEAVSHEENDDHEEGDIIEELRRGYQIGNRVIRPALVRVAK